MRIDIVLVARWLLELTLLSVLLAAALKAVNQRSISLITAASFGLRIVLGQALYLVSLLSLPVAQSLQTPGGFWQFSTDAPVYHEEGVAAAHVLVGQGTTYSGLIHPFSWVIGGTYVLFGATPSAVLLLNALFAAACVPLAYLAARWSDLSNRGATIVAAIVAFWPSSFAWSSQLLRDPLQWLAIFSLLASAAFLLRACARPATASGRGLALASVAALLAAGLTAWLRGAYESPAWVLAVTLGTVLQVSLLAWRAARNPPGDPTQSKTSWARRGVPAALLIVAVVVGSLPATGTIQDEVTPSAAAPEVVTSCRPFRSLIGARAFYIQSGGGSLIDVPAQFASCQDVLAYVPRALALALLAPFPRDWLRPGTATGNAARFSAIDAALLWLLFPGLAAGLVRAIWRPAGTELVLAIYAVVLAFVLGFAVANFGTLFRLRLQIILPAILLAVPGWQLLVDWLLRRVPPSRRSAKQVSVPTLSRSGG